ncbi:MAG TPA: rhomboid family intramembrane serine protease [Solirubrobacteraceae bacterium]|jgi:membrane associated rhomboid family serine protease|nr:rhomboid family intramembrane serine protease [Solirubrobacteraceae bacterium]
MATCYRHPSRETGVACSNCGRPICPDCMTTTAVGMRCPECSKQRTQVRRMREMPSIPRATYALIVLNVAVFFSEQGQFSVYGTGIHGDVVNEAFLSRYTIHVEHEYWRLISSAFIHENLLHIGFNMYLLYLLGMMLEPALGTGRFVAIYFTALLAGSLGVVIATAQPSLGASGAVFGLMGAAAVELRARRLSVWQSGIGGLIAINLVLSFSLANISVGAHVGGLIGGALAALALRTADARRIPLLGYAACAAIAAVSVAGAIAVAGASGSGFA